MIQYCKNCIYFCRGRENSVPGLNEGSCRKHSPTKHNQLNSFGTWPETNINDWCGDCKVIPDKEHEATIQQWWTSREKRDIE